MLVLASVSSYLFDAIQPNRYIFGLGYDHPSNTWGVNAIFTQSKAKSQSELLGQRALGSNSRDIKSTKKTYSGMAYLRCIRLLHGE